MILILVARVKVRLGVHDRDPQAKFSSKLNTFGREGAFLRIVTGCDIDKSNNEKTERGL